MAFVVNKNAMDLVFNFNKREFRENTRKTGNWPFFLQGLFNVFPTKATYICHDKVLTTRSAIIRVYHSEKINGRCCPSKITLQIPTLKIQSDKDLFSFNIKHNGQTCLCSSTVEGVVNSVIASDIEYPSPLKSPPTLPIPTSSGSSTDSSTFSVDKTLRDSLTALKQDNRKIAKATKDKIVESPWKPMNFGKGLTKDERDQLIKSVYMFEDTFYKDVIDDTPKTSSGNYKRKAVATSDLQQRTFNEKLDQFVQENTDNESDLLLRFEENKDDGESDSDNVMRNETINKDTSYSKTAKDASLEQVSIQIDMTGDKKKKKQFQDVSDFFGGGFNEMARKIKKEPGEKVKNISPTKKIVLRPKEKLQGATTSLIFGLDLNNLSKTESDSIDHLGKQFAAKDAKKKARFEELAEYQELDCKKMAVTRLKRSVKPFITHIKGCIEQNDYDPVFVATTNAFTEKQTDAVLAELSKQDIDQDKAVIYYLPEFFIYMLEHTYSMDRKEVLQHLAAQEELSGLKRAK